MKRSVRIATGIVVLLALVFLSGFVVGGGNALAAWKENKMLGDSAGFVLPGMPLQGSTDGKKDIQASLSSKASKETDIKKNLTISSPKTYNGDVVVFRGSTLTIKGGTVTVNGDLVIGGSLNVSGGRLIVNGDLWDYGAMTASGSSSITVNKAPKVITYSDGTIYCGGNLVISDHWGFGAALAVKGNAAIVINHSQDGGFFIQDGARFSMTSAASSITVNDRCYFGGNSTQGNLTAGTLTIINGGFRQAADYSSYSFCPSAKFNVIFKGTKPTQQHVDFDTPAWSYLTSFSFIGVTFTSDSWIAINATLTPNKTVNGNKSNIVLQGNLGNKTLTVTAHAVYPAFNGNLTIGGGVLQVNGAFVLGDECGFTMNKGSDKLIVNGGFYVFYGFVAEMTAGRIDMNGLFHQDSSSGSMGVFTPGPNLTVRVLGKNRSIVFDNPDSSYFTKFLLAPGASLTPDSNVSIKYDLSGDTAMPYPGLTYRGNLNHHMLTMPGSMTIPENSNVTVNGGILLVQGNLTVSGNLIMTNHEDQVYVGGDYTAQSSYDNNNDDMKDGRLSIHGNFTQSSMSNNFYATGNNTTILCGNSTQTITFNSTTARFAHLAILNPAVTPPDSSRYDDIVTTGTYLDGIAADAGALSPTFDKNTQTYELLLPYNTENVTLTPSTPAAYGSNVSMSISTDGGSTWQYNVTSIPLSGIKPDSIINLIIEVNAQNSAFSDAQHALQVFSYFVTIEQNNPYLKGLGTLPDGSYTDQPFDKDTLDYTVQLPETAASFTFAPQTDNPDSTLTVSLDGQPAGTSPTATVALSAGGSAKYDVVVTAEDKSTAKTYTVTFTRRAPLTGITVSSAGTLTPVFNPDTAGYNVYVPATAGSIDITAVRNSTTPDCAKVTLNGDELPGDKLTQSLTPGCKIPVVVQAWDADSKTVSTYTVTVYSIEPVSKISASSGTFAPAFSMGVGAYTVNLPATTAATTVSVTKTPSLKFMTINGKPAAFNGSGVATCKLSPPIGGKASVKIVATAQDGEKFAYTVTAVRAPLITGISLSAGALNPSFNAATLTYTVSETAKTATVTITIAKAAAGVKSITINSIVATTAKLSLIKGVPLTVTIVATASDGKTKVTYKVTILRAKK